MTKIRDTDLYPFIIDFNGSEYIVHEEIIDDKGEIREVNKKRLETMNQLIVYLANQLQGKEDGEYTIEEFSEILGNKIQFVKSKLKNFLII